MVDDINTWATAQPDTSVKVRNIPTHTTRGWSAVEEMVGLACRNLIVTTAGTNAITVTFDDLGFTKHSGAAAALPPYFIQSDISATTYTMDIDNGVAINGMEGATVDDAAGFKYLYALRNPATSTTGLLLSTNSVFSGESGITMPTGYTHGRRLGAYYFASSVFAAGKQFGNHYEWSANRTFLSGGNATTYTVVAGATFIPAIATHSFGFADLRNATAGAYTQLYIADDSDGAYPVSCAGVCSGTNLYTNIPWRHMHVSGVDIYYKVAALTGTATASIILNGYEVLL